MRYDSQTESLVLTAPLKMNEDIILQFLNSKQTWIWKQYQKERMVVQKENVFLMFGKEYPIVQTWGYKRNAVLKEDGLYLTFSKSLSIEAYKRRLSSIQKNYLSVYIESLRKEVEEKTKITGVQFHYRFMKSRFGSCMPKKKEIHLNLHLLALPEYCIQAVLYHEYAHFYVCNHSKEFYRVLNELCPFYKEAEKILKQVVLK